VSFVQLNLNYKSIFPVLDRNRIIYRGQIGTTLIDDLSLLPSSYRFYTGGDNSIRGFNYNTISPLNNDGDAIGAKHLFTSSIEYEHRIASQWALAVFTDFGSAFRDNFQLKKSVGAGARWFSPIGPGRFDVGVPINDTDNDFQIHITVGPDF
ncbi:MAG: autotransporter assembly complex family protein, partial [Marinicellaceae bacterium]